MNKPGIRDKYYMIPLLSKLRRVGLVLSLVNMHIHTKNKHRNKTRCKETFGGDALLV